MRTSNGAQSVQPLATSDSTSVQAKLSDIAPPRCATKSASTKPGLLRAHAPASATIAELDARLEEGLAEMAEQIRIPETVPRIDRGSACAILVELGPDLSGFDRTSNVAAWAGVAPGNNESAGKRRSGGVRNGNPTLRATLAECAHGAVRT